VTVPLAAKLFAVAGTPEQMIKLPIEELEAMIKPIGFYRAKAQAIQKLSQILIEKYGGKVPSKEKELLSLPSVGRKTANIILTTFFDTPQIAVDIHVHRITHRLGWVRTSKPEETEKELTKLIPKDFHSIVNRVFVAHGQQVCLPRRPKCTECPIENFCPKIGV
jgi:endonuclease-3